jgi:hypothetical protein
VDGRGGDVADKQVRKTGLPGATPGEDAAEPAPEEDDARDLEAPRPATASCALGVKRLAHDKGVRVGVEVEAREEEDDVEEAVLKLHEEMSKAVPVKGALVVGGPYRVKENG